jgi:DNA-binding MarR family transcriptional regulator
MTRARPAELTASPGDSIRHSAMRNISNQGDLDAAVARLESLLLDIGRKGGMRDPLSSVCRSGLLTPPQLHSLVWIGHDEPIAMGELARRSSITEKTITGIIDRLQKAGLVERERGERDRRVVLVRLTPQGRSVFLEMRDHARKTVRGLLALLEPADREALNRVLEKVRDRLSEGAEQQGARPEKRRRPIRLERPPGRAVHGARGPEGRWLAQQELSSQTEALAPPATQQPPAERAGSANPARRTE